VARPCGICQHEYVREMDKMIQGGKPVEVVARHFNVPKSSLKRHWSNHAKKKYSLPAAVLKAAKKNASAPSEPTLLDTLPPDVSNDDLTLLPGITTEDIAALAEVLPDVIDINKAMNQLVHDTQRYQRILEGNGDMRGALAAVSELRKHLETAEKLITPQAPQASGQEAKAEAFIDALTEAAEGNPELSRVVADALKTAVGEIE